MLMGSTVGFIPVALQFTAITYRDLNFFVAVCSAEKLNGAKTGEKLNLTVKKATVWLVLNMLSHTPSTPIELLLTLILLNYRYF